MIGNEDIDGKLSDGCDYSLDSENDQLSNDSNMSETLSVPAAVNTKGMSKSARNRYYAQTSRARHRQYVTNLEKDRQMLMERLEKIEEENKLMRRELLELRMDQRETKKLKTDNNSDYGDENIKNINSDFNSQKYISTTFKDPFNTLYNTTNNTNDRYFPINSFSKLSSFNSNNYALSVLDLLFPPSIRQPASFTNSPWPNLKKFKAPTKNFLVAVDGAGWRNPMNWKSSWLKDLKSREGKKKFMERNVTLRLLRLVKLAKLKIYLQQFGNI